MLTIFEGPPSSGQKEIIEALALPYTELSEYSTVSDHLAAVRRGFLASHSLHGSWLGIGLRDRLRTEPTFDPILSRTLTRAAYSAGAVVVKCLPPIESYGLGRTKYLELLYSEYYWAKWDLPTVVYDPLQDTMAGILRKIGEVRPKRNGGPGLGHWKQGVDLVVLDRPPPDRDPFRGVPFSVEITQTYDDNDVPESALYWIYAVNGGGDFTPRDWVPRLRPRCYRPHGKIANAWVGLAQKVYPCECVGPS